MFTVKEKYWVQKTHLYMIRGEHWTKFAYIISVRVLTVLLLFKISKFEVIYYYSVNINNIFFPSS